METATTPPALCTAFLPAVQSWTDAFGLIGRSHAVGVDLLSPEKCQRSVTSVREWLSIVESRGISLLSVWSKARFTIDEKPMGHTAVASHMFHVYCLHGLLQNIVSDQGPQFSSQFWKEFCMLLRCQ